MDELNFADQTVCVVGGSSGIGNGIAQAFRVRGADSRVGAEDFGNGLPPEFPIGEAPN